MAVLRRHPGTIRRASLGSIAAGTALFVLASVAVPIASADLAAPQTPRPSTESTETDSLVPLAVVIAAGPELAQAKQVADRRTPTQAKRNAPVDATTISALAANGIPKVALNAYRVAAARMGNVEPSCGIDWSLIAGIGRAESDHGRFGGATLHADGTSSPRTIGPALDGKKWEYIPAPANGKELDGDAKYAHALGPLQFIPSTWAGYGADANGDGKADIFNINDAALGAARYLCAAGGNLRTQDGRIRAVLTYNHNDQYLAEVLALADAYKSGTPISGIPLGNTSGNLPKLAGNGVIPPANPAAPPAAKKARDGSNSSSPKPSASKSGSGSASASSTKSKPSAPSGGAPGSPTKSGSPAQPSPSPTNSTSPTGKPSSSPLPTCKPLEIPLGQCVMPSKSAKP
ncbi:MAG: lytic murein transglycosylase [Jatrophihabitans sp.]